MERGRNKNEETGIEEIEDLFDGEVKMEKKKEDKYLGDIISTDGRNIKNMDKDPSRI